MMRREWPCKELGKNTPNRKIVGAIALMGMTLT